MPYEEQGYVNGLAVQYRGQVSPIDVLETDLVHPTHSDSLVDQYDPVVSVGLVGVARTAAAANTDYIPVDRSGLYVLPVVPQDGDGNSAINHGDRVYINKTTAILSKDDTGLPFGVALVKTTVSGGASAVNIHVAVGLFTGDDVAFDRNLSETLTAAAPAAKTRGLTLIDATSNVIDATIADGDFVGQEKIVRAINVDNATKISIATHETSTPEELIFNAVGDSWIGKWNGLEWVTIGGNVTTS